jgi:hypothetical protein
MVAQLNINPVATTNAAGTFAITLDGFMQGMAMDDPSMRTQLTGGQLDTAEAVPMWGGCAIVEMLAAGEPQATKPIVKHASSAALFTGFSVFNQDHAMINTPQSQVPLALPGMLVNLYRFGSLARIPMMADPALAATLPGLPIAPSALYWDPVNYWISATATGGYALPVATKIIGWNAGNSMTVAFNAATGFATWTRNGNCVLLQI